jgi:hypothetical protein
MGKHFKLTAASTGLVTEFLIANSKWVYTVNRGLRQDLSHGRFDLICFVTSLPQSAGSQQGALCHKNTVLFTAISKG